MTVTARGTYGKDIYYNGTNIDSLAYYDPRHVVYNENGSDFRFHDFAGDDEYYVYGPVGHKFIHAGWGADHVVAEAQSNLKAILGAGDDRYSAYGDTGDVISGNGGNDRFGLAVMDGRYYGNGGDDLFDIDFSIDFVIGGNLFDGGIGNDTISYRIILEDHRGKIVDLDKGYARYTDRISAGDVDRLAHIENVNCFDGDDRITGNAAANILSAGEGYDVIRGGGGNDRLIGGIDGDRLMGGTGADTFIYQTLRDSGAQYPAYARDVILDFSTAQHDRIDLSELDIDPLAKGVQHFEFIGKAGFSGTAGELRFTSYLLSGDADGDGIADFAIKLAGVKSLAEADLIL